MTWTVNINGHDDLAGDEKVAYENAIAALDCLGGDDNTPSAADLDRAAACIQAALEVLS